MKRNFLEDYIKLCKKYGYLIDAAMCDLPMIRTIEDDSDILNHEKCLFQDIDESDDIEIEKRELKQKPENNQPVFILKANDMLATHVIFFWIKLAYEHNVNNEKIESAHKLLREMYEWNNKHGSKIPN